MKCVPANRREAGGSTNHIGTDLGTLAGPILAGSIAEKFEYALMWRIMIFPIFIAMLIARRRKINNMVRIKLSKFLVINRH